MQKTIKYLMLFIYFISLMTVLSCNKKVEDIPFVEFKYPYENAIYSVGDTIDIHVSIQSNSAIKTIEFTLVDNNLIPVLANHIYPVDGSNKMEAHFAFMLDDYYMEGGSYQILCKVTNEVDMKHKYRSVIVSAVSKVLEDVVAVTRSGSDIRIWSLGPNLNKTPELKYEVRSDYSSSCYLPFHHRLVLVGSVSGDMIMWEYFSGDTMQRIPHSANPPFPFFSGLSVVGDYHALSYYQGAVDLYDYHGNTISSVPTISGFYPHKVLEVSPNFIIVQKQKNGSNQLISLHLENTAMQYASFNLIGDIVFANKYEENDFMIFYNYQAQGHIEKYIFEDNATTTPISYSGSAFRSITSINANNYLLSAGNQLLWYQYAISSISPIISGKALDHLRYESLSGRVYAAENQSVEMISVPSGQMINSVQISEEILNIHLIYNK